MAEGHLYTLLPQRVMKDCGMTEDLPPGENFLQSFIKANASNNRLKESEELKYKVHFLDNTNTKAPRKDYNTKGKRAKRLTAKERKKLKLFQIDDAEQLYEMYEPLHELWKDYIRDVVNFSKITDNNKHEAMNKLVRADYHGAIITVSRSKNPALVGLTGIILQETKNTFKVITQANQIKTLPKENSVFTFTIDGFTGTIYGRQFTVKSSERIHRKFKSKPTIDL